MLHTVAVKVFGSRNQRLIKQLSKVVVVINNYEAAMRQMSDEELSQQTNLFKQRIASGETLDAILPEAFAVVREASRRTIGLRHFDEQLIGGMVLHQGKIAEMCTGEGKTLGATLPAYLNALTGQGVHIVTVNAYLAARDAEWMKPIYNFLGMEVGVVIPDLSMEQRQEAYATDIMYGTNNEVGFDYLRDHMVFDLADRVQRKLSFCIVDEVDSVLIDEARTPLIISGEVDEDPQLFKIIVTIVRSLKPATSEEGGDGDFFIDEKDKQVHLNEEGHAKLEVSLVKQGLLAEDTSLYTVANTKLLYFVNACLRAIHCFKKDIDYIVKDGEVVIVDEHTGRTMPGRRWSDGLHQAIEAVEGVEIRKENKTLASITFQNYFRLYSKLAGMTGTADTEAYEFQQIYSLEVVVLPTHKPLIRKDQNDRMYIDMQEKYTAIVAEIKAKNIKGQPLLVGTASIESSEAISALLSKDGISHEVLNAKFHEREAHIVAQAGCLGAVTIATNMAGRGTDIVLGGNYEAKIKLDQTEVSDAELEQARLAWVKEHEQVVALGGLYVLGAERNESRRIDNQLRGRAGRQGDPGETRFYLSLDDGLMRIFASDKVKSLIQRLSKDNEQAMEQGMLSRSIESAQRKVEGHYFDVRKQLIRFDNVSSEQRELIYEERLKLISTDDIHDNVQSMIATVATDSFNEHIPEEGSYDNWPLDVLQQQLHFEFDTHMDLMTWHDESSSRGLLLERIITALHESYATRVAEWGDEVARRIEKIIILQSLDMYWQEHLSAMEQLRMGIHLRGYAQKDPVQEYKRESFDLFSKMLTQVKRFAINKLFTVQLAEEDEVDRRPPPAIMPVWQGPDADFKPKVSRNAICPCGSGKKYKRCCGRLDQ